MTVLGKLGTAANVKAAKPHAQKAEASVVKAKAKIEEPKKDDKPEAEDDEDDEDTEDDESDDDEVCAIGGKHDHICILELKLVYMLVCFYCVK